MNESLSVYLDLDVEKWGQNEVLIRRIDRLLLTVGMKYAGFLNMYIPVEKQKRDQIVFRAEELLRETDWLKDVLAFTLVGTCTNVCPIGEIRTDGMSHPSPEKLWYYEQYYQKTKRLPHAVVVDEEKQLRDGYISYLLAKKYDAHVDICGMVSGQPLKKIVKGEHVRFSDGKWRRKSDAWYIWIYELKEPVVPGDILLVNTKTGADFICLERIEYAAGHAFCSKYKTVRKHMKMHMEEEDTQHER